MYSQPCAFTYQEKILEVIELEGWFDESNQV